MNGGGGGLGFGLRSESPLVHALLTRLKWEFGTDEWKRRFQFSIIHFHPIAVVVMRWFLGQSAWDSERGGGRERERIISIYDTTFLRKNQIMNFLSVILPVPGPKEMEFPSSISFRFAQSRVLPLVCLVVNPHSNVTSHFHPNVTPHLRTCNPSEKWSLSLEALVCNVRRNSETARTANKTKEMECDFALNFKVRLNGIEINRSFSQPSFSARRHSTAESWNLPTTTAVATTHFSINSTKLILVSLSSVIITFLGLDWQVDDV